MRNATLSFIHLSNYVGTYKEVVKKQSGFAQESQSSTACREPVGAPKGWLSRVASRIRSAGPRAAAGLKRKRRPCLHNFIV
jgi:hypothetical protein